MKLYLVRHGEVNHNLYGLYNREDEDLNETGIKQAEELKEKIKAIKLVTYKETNNLYILASNQ